MHIQQHIVNVRQLDGEVYGSSKQAFQHTRTVQMLSGCKRRSQRQLPGHIACASTTSVQKAPANNSAAFADQDIFLVAGAGIAGLVSFSTGGAA